MSPVEPVPPPAAVAVVMPETGEASAVVTAWRTEPGDLVEAGESLVEVLIPGVTIEVAAPSSGRLAAIVSPVEARVRPHDVLGWI
ncbi:MAG: lipoyl domain-containing protein, partial [Planctomycetaceae bacterium]|nr:lipoyl domain-containing protein [Planctomycetaceae bacterium]